MALEPVDAGSGMVRMDTAAVTGSAGSQRKGSGVGRRRKPTIAAIVTRTTGMGFHLRNASGRRVVRIQIWKPLARTMTSVAKASTRGRASNSCFMAVLVGLGNADPDAGEEAGFASFFVESGEDGFGV